MLDHLDVANLIKEEYCQLNSFFQMENTVIASLSSDCIKVWKYEVFHSTLDNAWQNENYSFLLEQLFLYCVPAFLAIAGTAHRNILHLAWVDPLTLIEYSPLKSEQVGEFPEKKV